MVGSEKSRFVSSGDCWAKFTASKHLFMGIGRKCTLAVTRDVVGGSCAAASTETLSAANSATEQLIGDVKGTGTGSSIIAGGLCRI
ncbi:hypothetical protein LSAT2_013730 [Lamellibrachia satsuma]|nr:hypothetical protein LSAT2_013730 [Lamellibrachia satsuma]